MHIPPIPVFVSNSINWRTTASFVLFFGPFFFLLHCTIPLFVCIKKLLCSNHGIKDYYPRKLAVSVSSVCVCETRGQRLLSFLVVVYTSSELNLVKAMTPQWGRTGKPKSQCYRNRHNPPSLAFLCRDPASTLETVCTISPVPWHHS